MKLRVSIEGMSCQHCVKRVDQALKENFEGSHVNVDLEQHVALLESDQTLDFAKISEIIDDVGYRVVKIEEIV
jgi:copper chaperone CopZ